jgi:hypothetical protein
METAMPANSTDAQPAAELPDCVAELYRCAPATTRAMLLECLVRPVGLLALVAVADGVFAALRQRHGWQRLQVTVEDTASVTAEHVYQLATYLQQATPEVFRHLGKLLADNPAALTTLGGVLLLQTLHALTTRRA